MNRHLYLILILSIIFLGCSTPKKIIKVDAAKVNLVCIAEHKAVNVGVLESIKEGLTNHGIKHRVIPASYRVSDDQYTPKVQDDQVIGCDAILFYVANWTWNVTTYMQSVIIWMTLPGHSEELGFVAYEAPRGWGRYANAREKILGLIDELIVEEGPLRAQ